MRYSADVSDGSRHSLAAAAMYRKDLERSHRKERAEAAEKRPLLQTTPSSPKLLSPGAHQLFLGVVVLVGVCMILTPVSGPRTVPRMSTTAAPSMPPPQQLPVTTALVTPAPGFASAEVAAAAVEKTEEKVAIGADEPSKQGSEVLAQSLPTPAPLLPAATGTAIAPPPVEPPPKPRYAQQYSPNCPPHCDGLVGAHWIESPICAGAKQCDDPEFSGVSCQGEQTPFCNIMASAEPPGVDLAWWAAQVNATVDRGLWKRNDWPVLEPSTGAKCSASFATLKSSVPNFRLRSRQEAVDLLRGKRVGGENATQLSHLRIRSVPCLLEIGGHFWCRWCSVATHF